MNDETSTRPGAVGPGDHLRHRLHQRRHRAETELVGLELDVHQEVGTAGLERLLEGGDRRPARELDVAQRLIRQVADALRTPCQAGQIVVVEDHHLARRRQQDVELHTVRTVGARAPKGRSGVLGLARAGPAMSEDQRTFPRPSRLPHTKSVPPARRRIKLEAMSRRAPSAMAGALALGLLFGGMAGGCAHTGKAPPSGPGQALAGEASRIGAIAYEDDFLEARLVFQALPAAAPQRIALRSKLLHYLLDPVLALKLDDIRRETRELESDDVYESVFSSFRDALGLFDPSELWASPARVTPEEARLLRPAAELVVALYSPRGGDQQAVLALAALTTIAPAEHEWQERLNQVVHWSDEESNFEEGGGMHRSAGGSAIDALESALGDWPAPAVVAAPRPALRRPTKAVRLRSSPPALGRHGSAGAGRAAAGARGRDAAGRDQHGRRLLARRPDRRRGHADAQMTGSWRAMTATTPSCAPCWSPRPSPTRPRPTIWRWRGGSCRASTSWAGPPPRHPIRWWHSAF